MPVNDSLRFRPQAPGVSAPDFKGPSFDETLDAIEYPEFDGHTGPWLASSDGRFRYKPPDVTFGREFIESLSRPELKEILGEWPRSMRVGRIFGFFPFQYQVPILDSTTPDTVVNCGRQVGKTEMGSIIPADSVLTAEPETDIMVAGRWQDTADEVFRRATNHFKRTDLTNTLLGVETDNKTVWEFDDGCRLYSRALTAGGGADEGDSQRGRLPKVIVVDESAMVEESTFKKVLKPMFTTHGFDHEMYLLSTPRGQQGYHFEQYTFNEKWASFWVTAFDNPIVDPTFLESERDETDSITWSQEWLGQFIDESEVYLPIGIVRPCVDPSLPNRSPSGERFLGVDVARKGKDRTVYYGLDASGTTFHLESEEFSNMERVANHIRGLHGMYGFTHIVIDENNAGGGVVDMLTDLSHVLAPIPISIDSKQEMYQNLKASLENREIAIPEHDRLIYEMTRLQFEFSINNKLRVMHPPGGHDDYPDGLALANFGRVGLGRPTRLPLVW